MNSSNRRLIVRNGDYSLLALPTLTILPGIPPIKTPSLIQIPRESIKTEHVLIDTTIENHRSVSFDARSSATSNSTSNLTWSHTVSAAGQPYIGISSAHDPSGGAASSSYAGTALTKRLDPGGVDVLDYFDPTSMPPATGANTAAITTVSATIILGAAQSATGVDQTTVRTDTDINNATSAAPTFSANLTSGTDELCFGASAADFNAVNITLDAAWTLDDDISNPGGDLLMVTGHKVGSASVARTDSCTSTAWQICGVSLKASVGKGPRAPFDVTQFPKMKLRAS